MLQVYFFYVCLPLNGTLHTMKAQKRFQHNGLNGQFCVKKYQIRGSGSRSLAPILGSQPAAWFLTDGPQQQNAPDPSGRQQLI
jgi:hypothetical protein